MEEWSCDGLATKLVSNMNFLRTSNIPLINYNVRYQIYFTKKGVHTLCYVNTVLIVENMTVVFAAHVK